jgi:hypothetical protein
MTVLSLAISLKKSGPDARVPKKISLSGFFIPAG